MAGCPAGCSIAFVMWKGCRAMRKPEFLSLNYNMMKGHHQKENVGQYKKCPKGKKLHPIFTKGIKD